MTWVTWREATTAALYAPGGFYRRPEGPADHFRTSVHASPLLASCVLALARAAGFGLVVDVGSGRGELLRVLQRLASDLRLHGVDIAERPCDLPDAIAWSVELPELDGALLFANEWLDNIPIDVVEQTDGGPRVVEVDSRTGAERLGGPPSAEDAAWLERWWPLSEADPGQRAEVGWPRDRVWASAVSSLGRGIAVMVDYGHERAVRPPYGTMCSYQGGRMVPVLPDGSRDITAHVAVDACAVAGERAGASTTLLTSQRAALRALGLRGARPPLELAHTDSRAYLHQLRSAAEQGELIDPHGLGSFCWLVQSVGVPLPQAFEPLVAGSSGPVRSPAVVG